MASSITLSLASINNTTAHKFSPRGNQMAPRWSRVTTHLTLLSSSFSPTMSFSTTALHQARQLQVPSREEMLHRLPSVADFWARNDQLLEKAWKEWSETQNLPVLDDSVFHPKLREAIALAWEDPSKENLVRDLWEEVAPDVYQCQFFDPEKIGVVREYLDKAAEAGIPTRPPYGIVLNRKGFMIDPRSVGYLAIPEFQSFYRDLMDTYVRPLGRLFFPEHITEQDDSESFAFSIQYQAGKDQSIRQHTDASSLTLNINLNLPDGEEWTGSSLYFVDPASGKKNLVDFAPGVAVMHRGQTAHAALPIESGERSNLVLWLFGKRGYTSVFPYDESEQLSREERWRKPANDQTLDHWTPF